MGSIEGQETLRRKVRSLRRIGVDYALRLDGSLFTLGEPSEPVAS